MRSSKSNQLFFPHPMINCVSLAKIHPFIKEIECRQQALLTRIPTPMGSALKTICTPPRPAPPPHSGGYNYQDGGHLGFQTGTILLSFDQQVTAYYQPSFKSTGLFVQKVKFKIDFQDGVHGDHLGFLA